MWLIIECPVGTEALRRELGRDELLDCELHATIYANDVLSAELDKSDGDIPNDGSNGDLRVEFREDPDQSLHIWTGESFYLAPSDE